MPIDPSQALGADLGSIESSWDADANILYHLGLGAGVPPTEANELEYTFEKKLKVLPSYGVIPALPALVGMSKVPGMSYKFAMALHGEQDVEIRKPIPTAAKVVTTGKIAGLYDKGKACLAVLETETRDESGEVLFVNRFSLFLRGEGGFGGESGPKAGNQPPEREPDHVVESPTLPQQALLYRLSGDKNPLHADPEFAKLGGFDTPIMHGLCSYGIACKAAVDAACGGDTSRVARYQARFAGVAFPGETLVTSLWQEGDTVLLAAQSKERGAPVLSNAALTLR